MALDLFLSIEGVLGESQDAAFPNGMELLGFKLGGSKIERKKKGKEQPIDAEQVKKMIQLASAPKKEDEKPTAKFSFSIEKFLDSASPDLLKNYAQTRANSKDDLKPFDRAILSVRKPPANPGGKPLVFFTLEFEQVYVVEYEIDLDAETNTPIEDIKLCFNTCVMTYTPQKANGEPDRRLGPMGWDFFLNQRKPKQ